MDDERKQEINRKRKRSHDQFLNVPPRNNPNNNGHDDSLNPRNNPNNGPEPFSNLGNNPSNGHYDFLNPGNNGNIEENDDLQLTLSLRRPTRARLHSPPPSNEPPLPPPPLHLFFTQQPPQSALQLPSSRPSVPPPEEHLSLSHPSTQSSLQLPTSRQPTQPPPPPPQEQYSFSHPPPPESPLQLPTSHPMLAQPSNKSPPPSPPRTQEYSFFSLPPPQAPLNNPNNSPPLSPPPQRPLPPPGPQRRARRNQPQAPHEPPELTEERIDTITAPYPWATNYRCTVHTLDYLLSNQIHTISGEVQCKRCDRKYQIDYNLIEKFVEISKFIARIKYILHDRAPTDWVHPILPTCKYCEQENSAKPVMADSKKAINWLFLLLGQMIGCCTLEQLKYFCKHTRNHRTGAKDRVLFLTYFELCRQLDPTGPFERL